MNIIKNNKKGQGHVEMILSFVLFLGFIIAIFIFLNPLKFEKHQSSIENVHDIIIKNISSEIGILSIILNQGATCYNFLENYGDNFIEIKNERKYSLYFSQYFYNYHPDYDSTCASENYTLGVYFYKNFLIHSKVSLLKTYYEQDYNKLKADLGLTNDFSFEFKDIDGNEYEDISVSKQIPGGINVESRDYVINLMNVSASETEMILTIKAW